MKRFEELQVVEIAGSQAGALAGKLFADYGARVVKVEPPGGDPLRANGEPWGGMGSEFAFLNTSKRSVVLDLDGDAGLRRLAPLIERADVVIESAAPDPLQPRTASLGDERLVRVYVSPFGLGEPSGPGGPYARYRSNVFTDDAIGGHLWVGGDMDREPLQRRGLHTHMQAGLHAFAGAMAALLARERIGRGQSVDVSHQDGMASLHQHTTTMWTHGGHIIERAGNGQAGPWHPAGVYPCRDGYVFLGHSTGVKLVPFVEVLGYGHLFDDPRFATDPARAQHKREFDAALTERLMELTVDEITESRPGGVLADRPRADDARGAGGRAVPGARLLGLPVPAAGGCPGAALPARPLLDQRPGRPAHAAAGRPGRGDARKTSWRAGRRPRRPPAGSR